MKKTVLLACGLIAFTAANSQTTLFSENFETGAGGFSLNTADLGGVVGTGGDNFWIVNNVYTGGTAVIQYCAIAAGQNVPIATTDAQPAGISNANGGYLHILSQEANGSAIYNANYAGAINSFGCFPPGTHFAGMTNDINTTAFTGVTLDFWWVAGGNADANGEVYYSTDQGVTWVQKTGTTYQGVTTWTNETLTDPAWDGQTNLRFAFRFNNEVTGTGGTDPGFSIDDVEIIGTLSSPCTDSYSAFTETACFSYTVPSGDETYTTPGTQTVMDTILNVSGCDSIMTITLTINTVDNGVTDNMDGSATANAAGAAYQWLDCSNAYAVLTGETSATLIVGTPSDYAVEVTENGCIDTSMCLTLSPSGINEYESGFGVYPNPSEGQLFVNTSTLNGNQNMHIIDLNGRILMNKTISGNSIVELNLNIESGTYFISLTNESGDRKIQRLIIQ